MKDKILKAVEEYTKKESYVVHMSFVEEGEVHHRNFVQKFPYADLQSVHRSFLEFLKELGNEQYDVKHEQAD